MIKCAYFATRLLLMLGCSLLLFIIAKYFNFTEYLGAFLCGYVGYWIVRGIEYIFKKS